MDNTRHFLRHTLATLAYRGGKPLRDVPAGFAATRAGAGCRSAGQVLAHIGNLLDWALTAVRGEMKWVETPPQSWDADVDRFFSSLKKLHDYLASDEPIHCSPEHLFQGPIADAFTHVGQLATLRRLAGAPVRGENYYIADIAVGRVGAEQAAAKYEFD